MFYKHEANPQENNNAEARSQQSRFVTLLKSDSCTDMPPKIRSTSAEHPPLGDNLCGTAKTKLRLKYKKVLFKRNLLTLKMDK